MKAQMQGSIAATSKPMDFDDAFRARLRDLLVWRRDVRRFRREALPPGTVERLIQLACLAPSVGLSQPWRFVTVDDPAHRLAIRKNFESCNAAARERDCRGAYRHGRAWRRTRARRGRLRDRAHGGRVRIVGVAIRQADRRPDRRCPGRARANRRDRRPACRGGQYRRMILSDADTARACAIW